MLGRSRLPDDPRKRLGSVQNSKGGRIENSEESIWLDWIHRTKTPKAVEWARAKLAGIPGNTMG